MIKCPVCPAHDIPEDSTTCPSCDADLTIIHRLREIAKAQYNESLQMAKVGAIDNAITKAIGALSANDHCTEARKLLGKLFWKKKQFCQAIDQWEQALAFTPEDEELKELLSSAKQKLRLQTLKKTFLSAIILVVLLCIVFIPSYMLLRNIRRYSNNEFSNETFVTQREFNQFIEPYQETSKRLENLKQQIEDLSNQQIETISTLTKAIESNKNEIITAGITFDKRNIHLTRSLILLLESLRPSNAEDLVVEINELNSELERLHKLEKKYRSRGIILIDAINVNDTRKKINRIVRRLDSLQKQYNEQVVPWQRAMEIIKESQNESITSNELMR